MMQTVVDPQMAGIAGFGVLQAVLAVDAVHARLHRLPCPLPRRSPHPTMWAGIIEGETPDGFGFIVKDHVNANGYGSHRGPR